MESTSRVRQNRGKYKLLACVTCEKCLSTIYPDSPEVKRYRVRVVSSGFLQAPAFYYSHAPACPAN